MKLYLAVVQDREAQERQEADNNDRKNADILPIPRRMIPAPQVPHEHVTEKSFRQKRVAQVAPMCSELLTPVVSTVETHSGAQSLAHQMGSAYICVKKVGTNNRADGMS